MKKKVSVSWRYCKSSMRFRNISLRIKLFNEKKCQNEAVYPRKLPVSKYFKLATDYGIAVKKIVHVQFEMTAIPR